MSSTMPPSVYNSGCHFVFSHDDVTVSGLLIQVLQDYQYRALNKTLFLHLYTYSAKKNQKYPCNVDLVTSFEVPIFSWIMSAIKYQPQKCINYLKVGQELLNNMLMLSSCMTDGTNHKTASRRCNIILLLLPLPPPSSGFVEPSSLISAASGGCGGPVILRPFRFKLPFYFFPPTPLIPRSSNRPRLRGLHFSSRTPPAASSQSKKKKGCEHGVRKHTHTQIESTCHAHGPAWVCVCVCAAGRRVCLQLTWCHAGWVRCNFSAVILNTPALTALMVMALL